MNCGDIAHLNPPPRCAAAADDDEEEEEDGEIGAGGSGDEEGAEGDQADDGGDDADAGGAEAAAEEEPLQAVAKKPKGSKKGEGQEHLLLSFPRLPVWTHRRRGAEAVCCSCVRAKV